jgi:integrase
MPIVKITQLAAERLAVPKAGRVEYFDTALPSFGLRVSSTGHRAWILLYRVNGRLRRFTIGSFARWPEVAKARARAREILHRVERGEDPGADKPAARQPDTVRAVAALFIEKHAKVKNRSWRDTDRIFKRHVLPQWGDRDVTTITRRDVIELLERIADRGTPIAANRTLAAIRKMFAWAMERDVLTTSPVVGVKAPAVERIRERTLTDDEIVRLWHAAGDLGGRAGAFIRMLLITGQRRAETAQMRWADVDLTGAIWVIPADRAKNGKAHAVPLSIPALDVLRAVPRLNEYVFAGRAGRPIAGYSKLKTKLDALAGVRDWHLHDARRTCATGLARLGVPAVTIGAVLNHARVGVTGRVYDRHDYLPEARHALDAWGAKVESLVRPHAEDIVTLRG